MPPAQQHLCIPVAGPQSLPNRERRSGAQRGQGEKTGEGLCGLFDASSPITG